MISGETLNSFTERQDNLELSIKLVNILKVEEFSSSEFLEHTTREQLWHSHHAHKMQFTNFGAAVSAV
jgi:hypothetical protein